MQSAEAFSEIIIVGTGPSGVGAALGFAEKGIKPLILDVGHQADDFEPLNENLYEYRKANDAFDLMIGKNYEVINHVVNKKTPSPKISSPYMQYVTRDVDKLSPIDESGPSIIRSFSKGGLANAWGAALYRCLDDELVDLPVTASELSKYYDKLTVEVGISGDVDDLTEFFGSTENLLQPLKLSRKSEKILASYRKKKSSLNAKGIYMGRPRLGVLSQSYNGNAACEYSNLEMWVPNLPYIYTPAFTLQKLINKGKVNYQNSIIVKSWSRKNDKIIVHTEDINEGKKVSFKCKRLVLAAGTINTSKIVLETKKDCKTRLPLLDNTLVQIPLVLPSFIGSKVDKEAFALTNLNLIYNEKKTGLKLQGSIIELSSPARAVFYEMLPLSAADNLTFIRLFMPSLLILFLYFPTGGSSSGYVKLEHDDKLKVSSPPEKVDKSIIKKIIRAFQSLGVLTHSLLTKPPTHSIHYGGTLPMVNSPEKDYQCSATGELFNEPGVYIADGSLFSYIPSKNFSFTLMANAMRIADHISEKVNNIN